MKYELEDVVDNENSGGVKLIYSRKKEFSLTPVSNKRVIFLNPRKEVWEKNGKKFCKKGEWGSPTSPLSTVWIKVDRDYKSWNEDCPFIKHEVIKDGKVIKNLNNRTNEFSITEEGDEPTTNLGIRTILWLDNYIIQPFIDIFINQSNNQKTEKNGSKKSEKLIFTRGR